MKRLLVISLSCIAALSAAAAANVAEQKRHFLYSEVEPLSFQMQQEFAGLQYIMSEEEQRAFLEAPDRAARKELIRRFWISADPEPTLPGNPRRVEHYERMRWAIDEFPIKKWPGWDTRGEIMVRYGPPDYTGHVQGEVAAGRFRPPAELWYFKPHNMLIAFEDFEGKGNYKFALSSRGPYKYVNPKLIEFLLWDENPAYGGNIPADLIDPEYMLPEATRVTPETRQFMEKGRDMTGNTQEVFEEYEATYPFNFEEERRFPFFFDVSRFKGGEVDNRIDVNCQFIVEPPGNEEEERAMPDLLQVTATAVIYDENFNELETAYHDIKVDARTAILSRLIPVQVTGTIGQGNHHVAISLLEENTGQYQAFWTEVEHLAFADTLAVSDILFASRIEDVTGNSPFNRGTVEVIPHPVRRYTRGSSLPVYFEVYNLALDDIGRTQYEIEYRIVPRRGKKESFWDRFHGAPTVVASSFNAEGLTPDERIHFTVHTENLEEGLYDFLVSIKDTWSQSLAWREASFRIQQGAITFDEFKKD